MIRIEFGSADLAGLRFAHSPMAEVVASGLLLRPASRSWMYASWRSATRPRLAGARVAALLALLRGPTGYVPDFLTPVPSRARPSLDEELRVVADTPLDQVVLEVDRAWAGHPAPPEIVRFDSDPAAALRDLPREIRRYFAIAVAPHWTGLRAVVEGEIAHRALVAADHGPRALLRDLHPKLDWDGSALRLGNPKNHEWGLDGHQLALLPTGFAGPTVHLMTEAPTGRALWYPPRGYGRLWDAPTRVEASAALSALLGPTRGAVLTLLEVPSSTGEVAAALGLAPATASHHLTTLRDCGLVVAHRVGRRLRYLRTGLGEQLVG